MSLQTLSEWLRCPNCSLPLHPVRELVLGCPSGHAFDVHKRGFVSLAARAGRLTADSAAMLNARTAFLASGWYGTLRGELADLAAAEHPARILDIGCGTGYYLRGVLGREPAARALAMDLSPVAVARTVAGETAVDGLVADVWSPLPVRDGLVDVILNVFAPRNPAEFHRVLRPGGRVAVVLPRDNHLQELRAAGLALNVQANKTVQVVEALSPFFALESQSASSVLLTLNPAQVSQLLGMGPSAHHTDAAALAASNAADRQVTASFELLAFRRRP